MLARKSIIHGPNGSRISTPILIPSFSSKGWRFKKNDNGQKISEMAEFIEWSKEYIANAVLFSAYDLYYKYYHGPTQLGEIADITFIDSGGYETLEDHDLSSVYTMPWPIEAWNETMLKETIASLPDAHNIVIVNYDDVNHPKPISEQIKYAKLFFSDYPHYLHDFLIRTETKKQSYIQIDSVLKSISDLRSFHIIGVTEKELGNSLIDRMLTVAKLRMALDEHDIKAPIHIFGSLDPVASCHYFMAGAEIFDGLTWLRYAYQDGLTVYNDNYRFTKRDITEKKQSSEKAVLAENLQKLDKLTDEMVKYVSTENIRDSFSHHTDILNDAFDRLESKLERRF